MTITVNLVLISSCIRRVSSLKWLKTYGDYCWLLHMSIFVWSFSLYGNVVHNKMHKFAFLILVFPVCTPRISCVNVWSCFLVVKEQLTLYIYLQPENKISVPVFTPLNQARDIQRCWNLRTFITCTLNTFVSYFVMIVTFNNDNYSTVSVYFSKLALIL